MIDNYILESTGQSNIRESNLTIAYQSNIVQDENKNGRVSEAASERNKRPMTAQTRKIVIKGIFSALSHYRGWYALPSVDFKQGILKSIRYKGYLGHVA